MFNSIEEIRQANKDAEYHWFSKDTMRYFSSRISRKVYPTPWGAYFVSSERNHNRDERLYTVRRAISIGKSRGSVITEGDFQAHKTAKEAHKEAAAWAKHHNDTEGA